MYKNDTRELIVSSCFELLLAKGYDGVSITDIQKATGMARGLLYHYFGSKETLFSEAIKSHFTKLFSVNLEFLRESGVEQMSVYLVEKYRNLMNETLKGTSIIDYDFLFYRAMRDNEELASMYEGIRADELTGWIMVLRNSEKRGELYDGLDIEKIANQFVYLTDGVWMRAVTPSVKMDIIKSLEDAFATLSNLIKKI